MPDSSAGTVSMAQEFLDAVTLHVDMGGADHATLTTVAPKPDGKNADAVKNYKPGSLTLTRIPLSSYYPLRDRGFHWVNEWGLER